MTTKINCQFQYRICYSILQGIKTVLSTLSLVQKSSNAHDCESRDWWTLFRGHALPLLLCVSKTISWAWYVPSSSDSSDHRSSAVSPRYKYNYFLRTDTWWVNGVWRLMSIVKRLPGVLNVTQNLRIVLLFDRRVDRSSFTLLLPPFPFWTFLYTSAQSRDCKIFLWTINLPRTYQRVELWLELRLNVHNLIV